MNVALLKISSVLPIHIMRLHEIMQDANMFVRPFVCLRFTA